MRWRTCGYLIRSDIYAATGRTGARVVLVSFLTEPAARFLMIFRAGVCARSRPGRRVARAFTALLYNRYSALYGIELPFAVPVGPGLRINHRAGGIVVNSRSTLGTGVSLYPGVLLGNNSPDRAAPTLGSFTVIGPGAKIIGGITLGDHVQVGVNAVVIRDVPPCSVVAGVPARVLEGKRPYQDDQLDLEAALGPRPADLP